MKIGFLQCGHLDAEIQEKHGDYKLLYETMLAGHRFEFENYFVVDSEFPDGVEACDGWLVTGSRYGAYESQKWIEPLEEFIRQIYARAIPLTGICFGHQIMAQALGGKVEKFPGGWNIGQYNYWAHPDEQLKFDKALKLLAYHQDYVSEVPPGARVIMSNERIANAGLAYGDYALSFQPHPEFTPQFMRDLVNHKMSQYLSSELGQAAISSLEEDNDSALIANQIAKFLLRAHQQHRNRQAAE